jgi:hypothetical protein
MRPNMKPGRRVLQIMVFCATLALFLALSLDLFPHGGYTRLTFSSGSFPVVQLRRVEQRANAVCITGKKGAKENAHNVQYLLKVLDADIFIVSPETDLTEFGESTSVFQKDDLLLDFFNTHAPEWHTSSPGNHLGGLPGRSIQGGAAFMLRDRWTCEQIISIKEVKRGYEYESVGIGRLDLLWFFHPKINSGGCHIPCQRNDWGGVCDHWAWCDRNSARIYMTSPITDLPVKRKNNDTNVETLYKIALDRHGVSVFRTKAAFVRSCSSPPDKRCEQIASSGIHFKPSGNQYESSVIITMDLLLTGKAFLHTPEG